MTYCWRKWTVVVLVAFFTQGVLLPTVHAAHGCMALGSAFVPGMPPGITAAGPVTSSAFDASAKDSVVSSISGHHMHHVHADASETSVSTNSSDCAHCEAGCHFSAVVRGVAVDSYVKTSATHCSHIGDWFAGHIPPVDSPPPIVLT